MTKRMMVVAGLVAASVVAFPFARLRGARRPLGRARQPERAGAVLGWPATGKVACWEDGVQEGHDVDGRIRI